MVDHPLPSANSSSQMSLKVKMSNMNLSRMSAYSNYSMFSNESNESLNTASNTEPTEKSSIHTVTESVTEDTTSPISPSSIKLNFSIMKKSQSMVSSSSSSKVRKLKNKVWGKKPGKTQRLAISKKSTFLVQSSWNLVKIFTSSANHFDKVSSW